MGLEKRHKSNAELIGSWSSETELIKNDILQTVAFSGCDNPNNK